MTAILKTRSVTVQINGATLVDGIDLQVNRGEMVAMQTSPQRHRGDRNPARLNLAVRFADRIVVIHRGALAADDVPERTITDDIVRKVFEVDVAIQHHSNGSPLLPQLMRPATNA